MSGLALFLASVAVYAGFTLLVAVRRTSYRFLLLYGVIATTITLGDVLGAVYLLPIHGDVVLLAGQVAYGGCIFASLVTVVVGRDLRVLRNILVLVVVLDLLNGLLFWISHTALSQGRVPNPLDVSPEVFHQGLRVLAIGGALTLIELIGLLALLELAKPHLGPVPMGAVYVLAFVAIMALDGVVYPVLALSPDGHLGRVIATGVQAKLVLAAAYAVPLVVFVSCYRPALDRFAATPLNLRQLLYLAHDPLQDQLAETAAESGRREAMISHLLDADTSTAMVAVATDLEITHVNRGAERLLGHSREYLLGKTPAVFHTPEELARQARELGVPPNPVAVVRAAAEVGEKREWLFTVADGSRRSVSLDVATIRDDDGRILGYLCAGEDVTDQLKAQRALTEALRHEQDAVARLEAADRVKDELVSTVSHELRTPITSIHGYTELLTDEMLGELSDEQLDALHKVARNTSRLSTLVEDLLLVARSEADELQLRLGSVDLRQVIIGARDPLDQLAQGRDLDIGYDLPPLPVTVVGDGNALERVVLNLVGNAIKFTPDGGTVDLTVTHTAGGVMLRVADSGIGIAREELPQLFTRFFRSSRAYDQAIPGTGLGLSVVHGIVTRHGGTIDVESEPGRGTTVTVTLGRSVLPAP